MDADAQEANEEWQVKGKSKGKKGKGRVWTAPAAQPNQVQEQQTGRELGPLATAPRRGARASSEPRAGNGDTEMRRSPRRERVGTPSQPSEALTGSLTVPSEASHARAEDAQVAHSADNAAQTTGASTSPGATGQPGAVAGPTIALNLRGGGGPPRYL